MRKLQYQNGRYEKDGKPCLLISGEIPYFRVPRSAWRDRIRLFREAGGNTVATYMPWFLHERTEGNISFHGEDYLEIEKFLQICGEEDMGVIIRPGPYCYTEMRYCGLPEWLCKNYPEILARDLDGRIFMPASVSYTHPTYLAKARIWYASADGIIKRHSAENGGAIVAVQLDNEVMGIHHWFNGMRNEYNPETHGFGREEGRWPTYLREKYGEIGRLNEAWKTDYSSFAAAMPPDKRASDIPSGIRNRDADDYYYRSVAEYFVILRRWLREDGVDLPVIHNAPGTDAVAEFYDAQEALDGKFLVGSDHYYNLGQDWGQNNPTPRYAVWCYTSLEVQRNMGNPPTVFELPAGSCVDFPPILPSDLEAAYRLNAAFGMQGWNYYIFAGGPNPPDSGDGSDIYDYGAPVSPDGEKREHFGTAAAFNRETASLGLAGSELLSDFTVGYDRMMNRSWHFSNAFASEGGVPLADAWLNLRKGIVNTALVAGYTPTLCDLERHEPDITKPLWLLTTPMMPEAAQEKVADFLQRGGKLIYGPGVPMYDENFAPCTRLASVLGRKEQPKPCLENYPFIDGKYGSNIACNRGILEANDCLPGDEILLWERYSQKTAAFCRKCGGGEATWIGISWIYSHRAQKELMRGILRDASVSPRIEKDNDSIFAVVRRCPDGRKVLFVMNLYSAPQRVTVSVSENGMKCFIGKMDLKPMEVRIETIR